MFTHDFRLDFDSCRRLLRERLREPAPGRIQLLSGPRQVGKTTLLLDLAREFEGAALYFAVDGPENTSDAAWTELWAKVEATASEGHPAILLIDEIQVLDNWGARLKSEWDRVQRAKIPIHVVATGSSALRLGAESRETLAGRFERVTLTHWSASSLATAFGVTNEVAAEVVLLYGSYPGAFGYRKQQRRWASYMQDSILRPALGQDIVSLSSIPKPLLFRQLFLACVETPAQTLLFNKIQMSAEETVSPREIQDAFETLEEAYLLAALPSFDEPGAPVDEVPRKLVALNNGLISVVDTRGPPNPVKEALRYRNWVENACLAFAWNSGQRVSYALDKGYDIDGVLEGPWGNFAVKVQMGAVRPNDVKHLETFRQLNPEFMPLIVVAPDSDVKLARDAGIAVTTWVDFLVYGPPARRKVSYEPGKSSRA